METFLSVIQTVGFPIACVIGLSWFGAKYVGRIMDENKEREAKYQQMLVSYGEKMSQIAASLAEITNEVSDIKTHMGVDKD